jgi:hypothetical protein
MSVQNPEKWGIENEKWQIQVRRIHPFQLGYNFPISRISAG